MKHVRFAIYGDIDVNDDVDLDDLKEDLGDNLIMPDCGHVMGVDEVIVEDDEDDEE